MPRQAAPRRPTQEELRRAAGRAVPDIIEAGLDVLFCGINPGLYSAATGHHFARPGNRFWPALHLGGFTPRLLAPYEEHEILTWRLGMTVIVRRGTATAAELTSAEYVAGGRALVRKLRKYKPRTLAMLGVGAFRAAFAKPTTRLGLQPDCIADTPVWLLPNPSGLNANYQLPDLTRLFRELHDFVRDNSG